MQNEYAKEGTLAWTLVIVCPDGKVCTSVYHSWEALVEEVKTCWKEAQPYMADGHDFGDAELKELEEQKYLEVSGDRYFVDECVIG